MINYNEQMASDYHKVISIIESIDTSKEIDENSYEAEQRANQFYVAYKCITNFFEKWVHKGVTYDNVVFLRRDLIRIWYNQQEEINI